MGAHVIDIALERDLTGLRVTVLTTIRLAVAVGLLVAAVRGAVLVVADIAHRRGRAADAGGGVRAPLDAGDADNARAALILVVAVAAVGLAVGRAVAITVIAVDALFDGRSAAVDHDAVVGVTLDAVAVALGAEHGVEYLADDVALAAVAVARVVLSGRRGRESAGGEGDDARSGKNFGDSLHGHSLQTRRLARTMHARQ
jgi:hypothetical protein